MPFIATNVKKIAGLLHIVVKKIKMLLKASFLTQTIMK